MQLNIDKIAIVCGLISRVPKFPNKTVRTQDIFWINCCFN